MNRPSQTDKQTQIRRVLREGLLGHAEGSRVCDPADPTAFALANFLKAAPYPFEDKWFNQKRVELDGFRFVRCRFDECELIVRSGNIDIEACVFNNCQFQFQGTAGQIARLDEFARRHSLAARELVPEYHADGSISLK